MEAFTATDLYLTANRNLTVHGAITATDTADLLSHSGIITVNGTVLGGQVYITTGVTEREEGSQVGNIVINNDVTTNGEDGSISITANVGDIQTADAVALDAISGSVSIGTGTGSISVEAVEAGRNISLTTTTGHITSSGELEAGGSASLNTGKGNVTVTGAVDAQDNVTIETGNGGVTVTNNVTSHAGDISVTSKIGDITSSGVLSAGKKVSLNALTSGEIYVNNQINGKNIEILTDNGDVETVAEGILTATAEGGTITVGATKFFVALRLRSRK